MARSDLQKVTEFPRRIMIFIILLASLLILGTISAKIYYKASLHDSFIMTLESLAFMFHDSPGFGKIMDIFLSIFGVFLIWWILWGTFDMLLEGSFSEYLKISSFFNKLKKMRNHYIIAGGGRVGEDIALHLSKLKKEYILVEKDIKVVSKLKGKNLLVINGDAVDEGTLKQANIKEARAIILTMPETEKNLLATMIAKEMNPNIEIYARADKPAFASKLKKAGAKAVFVPEIVAAEKFLEEIEKGAH